MAVNATTVKLDGGEAVSPVLLSAAETGVRDPIIDFLKGAAILLVVLGHAIQYTTSDFESSWVYRFIYSFHMPLFMFLAGVVARRVPLERVPGPTKPAVRLLVPYFAWATVAYLIVHPARDHTPFFRYLAETVIDPETGLWFLWVLFINHALLYLASQLRSFSGRYALPIVLVAVQAAPFTLVGWKLVQWYSLFYFAGFVLKGMSRPLSDRHSLIPLGALVLYCLLMPYWHRSQDPSFAGDPAITGSFFLPYVVPLYKLLVPSLGIILMFALARTLHRKLSGMLKPVTALGKRTLDVYVSHLFFITLVAQVSSGPTSWASPAARIATASAAGIAGSLAVSSILTRLRIFGVLFYGRMPLPGAVR